MSYIDKNLMTGEEVIYRAKLHWFVFVHASIWVILSIILVFYVSFLGKNSFFPLLAFIVLLLALVKLCRAPLSFLTSEFAVTNKRVMIKVGIIRRRSLETILKKVESIIVNQTILGRILGYGSITISGTGGTKESFKNISNPMEFRKQINEQVEKAG